VHSIFFLKKRDLPIVTLSIHFLKNLIEVNLTYFFVIFLFQTHLISFRRDLNLSPLDATYMFKTLGYRLFHLSKILCTIQKYKTMMLSMFFSTGAQRI
jgi:hypothetical protein